MPIKCYRFVTNKHALRKILRVLQDVINVRIANKTFHSLSIIGRAVKGPFLLGRPRTPSFFFASLSFLPAGPFLFACRPLSFNSGPQGDRG